ncbi:macro domain-containing protein [Streptomyces specialis]|uniref:macro domain-containing protein n=1 Tax=Streptomyces specialis TaxID=498367 RepID=UPI00073F9AA9|nr:macro domain-containing protein [Streptomyces specialis]
MGDVWLTMLGSTTVTVGGRQVRPPPTTTAVLARLVVAEGEPVTVDELFHDVWGGTGAGTRREDRVSVQKRVLELRRLLDPDRPGGASGVLLTERGRVSAYRLVLRRDQVDLFAFRDLVERARRTAPTTSAELLTAALELWGGRPLFDVEDRPFAREPIRRLKALHEIARRELLRARAEMGQVREALDTGEGLARDFPGDTELAGTVDELRERARARAGGVLRRDFPGTGTSVVVTAGDLFAQDDAHLAVGFTDTFDTATDHDVVISARSVQGQMTRSLYGDDRARLDRDLRNALRGLPAVAVERRADKRHGKLTRYPVGTVLPLRREGRRIFAVAYSRMGNDLIARSSLADLLLGLDHLWDAMYLHGQRRTLAVPLLGSGLARIDGHTREDLLAAIIGSFLTDARHRLVSRELRVVLRPADLPALSMATVARHLGDWPDVTRDTTPPTGERKGTRTDADT